MPKPHRAQVPPHPSPRLPCPSPAGVASPQGPCFCPQCSEPVSPGSVLCSAGDICEEARLELCSPVLGKSLCPAGTGRGPEGQGWGGCPQQIPASSRLSEGVGCGGSTGEPVTLESARLLRHVDFCRHLSLALETAHLLISLVCLELTSLPSLHLPSWKHLHLESGFCRWAPRAEALLCASPGSLHPSWDSMLCFPWGPSVRVHRRHC